jgi:glycosyltransferase involved in cell wall biosynthesis
MRVLYVYNKQRGGGGSNRATERTIELLQRYGFEVAIFSRDSKELPAGLAGRLEAGVGAIYPRKTVREFEKLLDSFMPDLVHAYELFPLISPWILPLCTRRHIPVVMNCDDYHMTCPVRTHVREGKTCTLCTEGREYWSLLNNCRGNIAETVTLTFYSAMVRSLRLFRNHISHYIAASDFTRDWLIRHAGVESRSIATVEAIVEAPAAAADPSVGTYIGFAGRFVPEKGSATLLEAARISKLPFRCSLIDEAPLPPDLDTVSLDRQEVNSFYRAARIIVFPSIWFETFGLVAAEAMSHGIPVVASRIGAIPHLIDDGVDGVLFEPGNAVELAEKLARLWHDPARCVRLGSAARQKAKSRWSAETHLDRLLGVYEKVCPRQKAIHLPRKLEPEEPRAGLVRSES